MSRDLTVRSAFFWYALPVGGAIFIILAFGAISIFSIPRVDNPPSTGSIVDALMITIPVVFGVVAGIIAFLAGGLIEWVSKLTIPGRYFVVIRYTIATLLVGSGAVLTVPRVHAMYEGKRASMESYNRKNAFGVKYDAGVVMKIPADSPDAIPFDATRNRSRAVGRIGGEELDREKAFEWGDRLCTFDMGPIGLANYVVSTADGREILARNLLDYTNGPMGSTFVILPTPDGSYLFVLNRMRATSRRSLLDVYSQQGDLVYTEMVRANDYVDLDTLDNGEIRVVLAEIVPRPADSPFVRPYPFAYDVMRASPPSPLPSQ